MNVIGMQQSEKQEFPQLNCTLIFKECMRDIFVFHGSPNLLHLEVVTVSDI
jgi:hypothetical protein